jgi:outer membrane protein OmpA-like peptidoglycan-associated protein
MSQIINRCTRIAVCAATTLLFTGAYAQTARKIEKSADAAFSKGDYYSASKLYSAILYDSPLVAQPVGVVYPFQSRKKGKTEQVKPESRNAVTYKLAESYRLYNRPKEALQQYEKYIASQDQQYPQVQLWYGYTLIANNEPEKATAAFNAFLKKNNRAKDPNVEKAREGIASANFIIASRVTKPDATISKLKATASTDGSDFGLEKINDSIFWFTTSRHELDKKGEKIYPVRLYKGNLNNNVSSKLQVVPGELNMATPSVSADGLTMYFTGWKNDDKKGSTPYQLYYLSRKAVDSPWHLPVALPATVNVPGYNAKQPYISQDQQWLFFASDQPGGLGKFDIWAVQMNGHTPIGKPSRLENLNTAGDDVTPFYDADSAKLYFSSNGRVGMGGLDIYSASGNPGINQWKNISNLGAPLNSVRDDQYYRREKNSQTAYLSSDRASSCCLEIFKAVAVKYIDTPKAVAVIPKPQPPVVLPPVVNEEERTNKRMLDSINAITLERDYVHYDYASSKIRKADMPQLDDIVRRMKLNPALNIMVASFTDCMGTVEGNLRVARSRSQSVKMYLISKGVAAERINTDFFGKKHFILACFVGRAYNEKEQIANRRSDLILTKEAQPIWRPLGNELDIDPSKLNPLYRTVNTNFDNRSLVASNASVKTNAADRTNAGNELKRAKANNAGTEKASDAKDNKPTADKTAELTETRSALLLNSTSANGTKTAGKETNSATGNLTTKEKNTGTAPNPEATAKNKSSKKTNEAELSGYSRSVKNNNTIPASKETAGNTDRDAGKQQVMTTSVATENKTIGKPGDRQVLDVNKMLDFTPRVKNSVVAEMTKRIPRQPLLVYSSSDSVRVDLYDNGVFDKDSVSVIFNKQLVSYKQVLETNKAVSFYVKLSGDPSKNEMILFAENMGLTPPNSALMVITDGDNKRTEVNVTSDLEHNTVIYFIKVKKEKP